MADVPMSQLLSAAAADVLETMFFTPVMGEAEVALPPASAVAARLHFAGARPGTFALRVSEPAAATIAANFLGEEVSQPTPGQVRDVICELANMICGSALSRLDSEAHFDLGHPELVEPIEAALPDGASRAFDIGEGEVAVFLRIHVQP
jgi:CheY-specific phosphatase CheX